MSEAKHTPGPWHVASVACNDYAFERLVDSAGNSVIDGNFEYCRTADQLVCFPDASPADLRLAAAAPELLEACEAWAEVTAFDGGAVAIEADHAKQAVALGKTLAAIAKAKGEKQ